MHLQPTPSEVADRLRQLAAEQTNLQRSDVTLESHLQNDLGFDSLDHIDYAAAVEEEYDIRIPERQVRALRNVGQVLDTVLRILPGPSYAESRAIAP